MGTSRAQIKEYERRDPGGRALIGLREDSSRGLHLKVVLVCGLSLKAAGGAGYEAQTNCVIGAVETFASYYHSDEQAHELRGSFKADVRGVCLKGSEDESFA